MTVPLSAGSPRLAVARKFGAELDRAMRTRKVGAKRLGPASGIAVSAIGNWRAGLNFPRLDTAQRLADALNWPALATIVRDGRSQPCVRCGTLFLNEGGTPKRFCSLACRLVDSQLRKPQHGASLGQELRDILASKEGVRGGIAKRDIETALTRYNRRASRSVMRTDQQGRQLAMHQAAVDAFCGACEPAGKCHDAGCAHRPVSPLPVAEQRDVDPVLPAPGLHSPEHKDKWLAAVRAGSARRWARPGEREKQSAETRARFAGMTDEERTARGQKISRARRAA